MKLYDSENEIEAYLREGTPEERINALISIKSIKENYERVFEIFVSDINRRVKGNALCAAMHSDPKRIWEITEYLFENEYHDEFFRLVLKHLLEFHKKGKISGPG